MSEKKNLPPKVFTIKLIYYTFHYFNDILMPLIKMINDLYL